MMSRYAVGSCGDPFVFVQGNDQPSSILQRRTQLSMSLDTTKGCKAAARACGAARNSSATHLSSPGDVPRDACDRQAITYDMVGTEAQSIVLDPRCSQADSRSCLQSSEKGIWSPRNKVAKSLMNCCCSALTDVEGGSPLQDASLTLGGTTGCRDLATLKSG